MSHEKEHARQTTVQKEAKNEWQDQLKESGHTCFFLQRPFLSLDLRLGHPRGPEQSRDALLLEVIGPELAT